MKNKKGQSQGLVGGLIASIIGLVVVIIIGFVVIQSISDADLLGTHTVAGLTADNESDVSGGTAYVNLSGYTVLNANASTTNFIITNIWASTGPRHGAAAVASVGGWGYNYSIATANASINPFGLVTNVSDFNQSILNNVTIVYTYDYIIGSKPAAAAAVDNLTANLSAGIGKVSAKIPTILAVAAVVILLGILAFLVVQARKTGMFAGGGGGSAL